jgi:sodium-dependent dicarboxylate transporter 2/3/5
LLLVAAAVLVRLRIPVPGRGDAPAPGPRQAGGGLGVGFFAATVALWLAEPLHGVSAPVVAVAAAAALFLTGLLERADLERIDWSTLLLIGGGIGLGRLLEKSGVVSTVLSRFDLAGASPFAISLVLVVVAAVLSSIMSNTATAALLVPIGASLLPEPSTPVLIAVGCSLGMPFVISTPPNAMAVGTGAVTSKDLMFVGVPLLIEGALLVAATGRLVLGWFGL